MSHIDSITIIGGRGKDGEPEPVERVELKMGNVASIVGPTGSGKTTLINDVEMFADGDTPSLRRVLINGERPPREYRHDPSKNPIALITQHTTFLSDLPVGEFLEAHATVRAASGKHPDDMIKRTIDFANQLTGEPVNLDVRMTELSGGQTRASPAPAVSRCCASSARSPSSSPTTLASPSSVTSASSSPRAAS